MSDKNSNNGGKKKKPKEAPMPNKFMMENWINSISIYNLMCIAEIMHHIGMINDKKAWRKQAVDEWINNMKRGIQDMVNNYSTQEKYIRKLKKRDKLNIDVENTEDIQVQGSKNLSDFYKFLTQQVIDRELKTEDDNDKDDNNSLDNSE